MSARAGIGRRLTLGVAILTMATSLAVVAPTRAVALDRLAVQLSGVFTDSTNAGLRSSRVGVVVGSVATTTLGAVSPPAPAGHTWVTGQNFSFSAVCASAAGASCRAATVLLWDYGDGTSATTTVGTTHSDPDGVVRNALTTVHAYTSVGAYTVTADVNDPTTPAYGTGSIRALVGAKFADVDNAYVEKDAAGVAVPGKFKDVNAASEAIWAASALHLMSACRPSYSAYSATTVAGERPEDPGRALFCPDMTSVDPVASAAMAANHPTTQPAPRVVGAGLDQYWAHAGTYTDGANCLANASNCGLPMDIFVNSGNTSGNPLSACTSAACLAALAARGITTGPVAAPVLKYDPTNCSDNIAAVKNPTGADTSYTLVRGVEAGCVSRGDFLRSIVAAVDGANVDALNTNPTSIPIDATACATGPAPDAAGRDGVRRATAILKAAGLPTSPCDPDVAMRKGEAYRIMAVVLKKAPDAASPISLPDLADRALSTQPGVGTEPTPGATQIANVLAKGAPLVGNTRCPIAVPGPASCFNEAEPLTRAGAAALLTFFALGASSDVAAVQATLSVDAANAVIGDTIALRLRVAAPAWLWPYPVSYSFTLGGLSSKYASFNCAPTGTANIPTPTTTPGTVTLFCPVTILAQPPVVAPATDSVLPLTVTVNGDLVRSVNVTVSNHPPGIDAVTSPALLEDQGPSSGPISATDPDHNPIPVVQVASAATGPWDSFVDAGPVKVSVTSVQPVTGISTLTYAPDRDANGPYSFWVRVCDSGGSCSVAVKSAGSVTAVNDAPRAAVITSVVRNDNIVSTTGDCRTQQGDPVRLGGLRLVGDDPNDVGRPGYPAAIISSYNVSTPAGSTGLIYVCNASGVWSPVGPGTSASSANSLVLYNPVVGSYVTHTFTYTVTDGGWPTAGAVSAAQTITASNVNPNANPTALLDSGVPVGATATTDFTFTGARSNVSGDTSAIISYAYSYGDGTSTSAQSQPALTHRYATAGTYTVTLTVTTTSGATATATASVTAKENLVGNGTFETGVSGWSATGATLSTSAAAHGGLKSALVTRTSGTSCVAETIPPRLVGATADATPYTLSLAVLPNAASAGSSFTITTTETTPAGAVAKTGASTTTLGAAGTWQVVTTTFTSAGAGDTLTLRAGLTTFAGTTCFNIDDASVTGAVGASTYANAVLADNPLAYYKLDEAAGSVAYDTAGANNGTYRGAVTLGQPPLTSSGSGAAAKFGANGAVNLTGLGVDTTTSAGLTTVEFWFTPTAYGQMPFGFTAYDLYFLSNCLGFNTGQGDCFGVAPPTGWLNNTHHVVATFSNNSAANNTLYLDGVQQSLTQLLGTPAVGRKVSAAASISGWPNSPGYYLSGGTMDEVSVYNGALSADRVAAHYLAGAPTLDMAVKADTPVGYYKLDESTGTVATDSAGANNGTYTGPVTLGGTPLVASGSASAVLFGATGTVAIPSVPVDVSAAGVNTVEMWVKPGAGANQMLFGFAGYDLFAYTGGNCLGFNTGNSDCYGVVMPANWAGVTHHIVAVMHNDGVTNNKLYLDGVAQALTQRVGAPLVKTAGTSLNLSGWVGGGYNLAGGAMDEAAVYNKELPAAQVGVHYRAGAPAYVTTVMVDNPTGYWRLGESAGTVASDSSGNALTGSYVGGVTLGQAGAVGDGTAALLDGSTGYANLTNNATLQVGVGSLEAWVKTTTPGSGYRGVAVKQYAYGVFLLSGQPVVYDWTIGPVYTHPTSIADGAWHQLVLTFRDGVSGGSAFYVDGAPVGTFTWRVANQATALVAGAGTPGVSQTIAGTLDEVSAYNQVLSAARVLAHYNAGK